MNATTAPRKQKPSTLRAKPDSQLPIADRNVTMANVIVRASHSLTLSEKRLIAAALARTDATDARALTDAKFWTVKISAMEYRDTFGVDLTSAYEQISAAATKLLSRVVTRPVKDRNGELLKHQWFARAVYSKGRGTVTVTWHEDIREFVFWLRRDFTTYKLKQAAALRSVYSWLLFENLKSWRGVGKWNPNLDEFTRVMDAVNYRGNFRELRRRVIEPAVKELTTLANLTIQWEPVSEGRKVVGLRFVFSDSPQFAMDLEPGERTPFESAGLTDEELGSLEKFE